MYKFFNSEMIHQSISLLGAIFVLIAYLGQQTQRIHSASITYHLLNTIGSTLLVYVALHPLNIGFLLAESIWLLTSLIGLYKTLYILSY